MKKQDKHRHVLYEIEMRIIALESRARIRPLDKKQEGELEILRKRKIQLEERIRTT